jgi:hypothetical protein
VTPVAARYQKSRAPLFCDEIAAIPNFTAGSSPMLMLRGENVTANLVNAPAPLISRSWSSTMVARHRCQGRRTPHCRKSLPPPHPPAQGEQRDPQGSGEHAVLGADAH